MKTLDLTGQKYGMLTVIMKDTEKSKNRNKPYWLCKCDCGNQELFSASQTRLRQGKCTHCGCNHKLLVDLTGQTFGRLTVLRRDYTKKSKRVYWICQCSCENKTIKSIAGISLTNGDTKSCGCYNKELVIERHKKYNTYDLSGEYGIGYTDKGEVFYFDLEDYDKIKNYYWRRHQDGYMETLVEGSKIYMHRLIMNLLDDNDKTEIDHKRHVKYDNRKNQLRIVTRIENSRNKGLQKGSKNNNKTGVTGVCWNKKRNKWFASIHIQNKKINLGLYDDFEDAVKARKEAEEKYFGEYSYDNSMKLDKENTYDNIEDSTRQI